MKDGVELDRIQLWFLTHFNKKTNKWSIAISEEIYVNLDLENILCIFQFTL